jgi:hypothetical protein
MLSVRTPPRRAGWGRVERTSALAVGYINKGALISLYGKSKTVIVDCCAPWPSMAISFRPSDVTRR